MAEERNDSQEMTWRTLLPWTELFRGFQIALDPNKLFLAAIGIVLMAIAWWFLALIFGLFYGPNPPDFDTPTYQSQVVKDKPQTLTDAWAKYTRDRRQWNLMHKATGIGIKKDDKGLQVIPKYEVEDLVTSKHDYDVLKGEYAERNRKAAKDEKPSDLSKNDEYRDIVKTIGADRLDEQKDQLLALFNAKLGQPKPHSELNTLPWYEDRGPNPFLMVTGQSGRQWEAGHFWEWFLTHQLPVVIEPLVKLVMPLVFFFNPDSDGLPAVYFFLVFAATVAIWSLIGGAITRIAAVQVARGEKIDFMEAVRFTLKRWASYLMAPVYPLGFVVVLIVFAIIFGLLHMIPFVGDIFVSGLFWPVPLVLGFVIGLAVIGLVVGWPLMAPTISTEGTDSWEALSRSFSYVFQKPFHYLWYAIVAMCYAAVLIFVVGFIGSFTVYLSKWAVEQTPFIKMTNRDPVYLFVYAPESFGWRELLLKDKLVDGDPLVKDGKIQQETYNRYLANPSNPSNHSTEELYGYNKLAAVMVAFWLFIVFLLVIGFGYSLFWSLMTIIYFLLRRDVDAAEMDEVYLEEDEHDLAYSGPLTPPAAPPTKPDPTPGSTMVESPTLRTPGPTTATPMPTSTPTAPPSTAAVPAPVTRTPTVAEPVKESPAPAPTAPVNTADGDPPPP